MEEEFWTTRDGRRIAVGDMEVAHVRNTLRMILRERRQRKMAMVISTKDGDMEFNPLTGEWEEAYDPREFNENEEIPF